MVLRTYSLSMQKDGDGTELGRDRQGETIAPFRRWFQSHLDPRKSRRRFDLLIRWVRILDSLQGIVMIISYNPSYCGVVTEISRETSSSPVYTEPPVHMIMDTNPTR